MIMRVIALGSASPDAPSAAGVSPVSPFSSEATGNATLRIRTCGFDDPVFWGAFVCVGDPSRVTTAMGSEAQ
jgi:hypothetical protein